MSSELNFLDKKHRKEMEGVTRKIIEVKEIINELKTYRDENEIIYDEKIKNIIEAYSKHLNYLKHHFFDSINKILEDN